MKINTIIVHLSARFLKLYMESSSFWIGQRETVDCIRCYSQIYFAICMGHAWNWVYWNRCLKTFPSMCDSPHLRAGCTLQLGSGNLADSVILVTKTWLAIRGGQIPRISTKSWGLVWLLPNNISNTANTASGYGVRTQRWQSRIALLDRSSTPLPLVLVRRAVVLFICV